MTEFSYKNGYYYWKKHPNFQYFKTEGKWYLSKNDSPIFYQLKSVTLIERFNNFSRKLKLEKLLT